MEENSSSNLYNTIKGEVQTRAAKYLFFAIGASVVKYISPKTDLTSEANQELLSNITENLATLATSAYMYTVDPNNIENVQTMASTLMSLGGICEEQGLISTKVFSNAIWGQNKFELGASGAELYKGERGIDDIDRIRDFVDKMKGNNFLGKNIDDHIEDKIGISSM